MSGIFGPFKTRHHVQTPAERALRLLWSPEVFEVDERGEWLISDAEIERMGRLLGLTEAEHHITVSA